MQNKLKEVIAKHLEVPVEKIDSSKELKELGLDSLDFIEIILVLEYDHDIEIPDEKLINVKTIEDLETVIEGHLNEHN